MKRKDFIKLISVGSAAMTYGVGCKEDIKYNILNNRKKKANLYTKEFNYKTARNLLSRITFGFTNEDIEYCIKIGFEATIDYLLRDMPQTDLPVNFEYKLDNNTPIGKTWMFSPMSKKYNFEHYRKKSFEAWLTKNIYFDKLSSIGQMTLFWHNLFPVTDIMEPKYNYVHFKMCRDYAFGNYKEFVKKTTIDTSMLTYLNGNQNNKYAPNENYARELLELFTIGRGKQIKEGDYTNYTEYDILQIAKALTGWEDFDKNTTNLCGPKPSKFTFAKHDCSYIRLSEKFDYKRIPLGFSKRYEYVIDVIFGKEQTAINICEKLYRWFACSTINTNTREAIIYPMSYCLIQNDFNIRPVLKLLFSSTHFMEIMESIPKIKNPVEYSNGLLKFCNITLPAKNIQTEMNFWHELFLINASLGIDLLKLPSVAGLKEYYHEPTYYRLWVNAATLRTKRIFLQKIIYDGFYDGSIKADISSIIMKIDETKPTDILKKLEIILFNKPLPIERITTLTKILLSGMTSDEFESNINTYLKMKNMKTKHEAEKIEINFKNLLFNIFCLPEFNLL